MLNNRALREILLHFFFIFCDVVPRANFELNYIYIRLVVCVCVCVCCKNHPRKIWQFIFTVYFILYFSLVNDRFFPFFTKVEKNISIKSNEFLSVADAMTNASNCMFLCFLTEVFFIPHGDFLFSTFSWN